MTQDLFDFMPGSILGIDLGTTNTCMAIMDKTTGRPMVIVNQDGARITPSVVAFIKDKVLVGQRAKNQAVVNPQGTFYGAKRLIGKQFEEVQDIIVTSPFSIVSDSSRNEAAAVEFNGTIISPQEISAHILRTLKEAAEMNLGTTVTKAVLSVPAYFNDAQHQATKDAGQIAGLEVLRIITEPTAVALAYGMSSKEHGKIAIYQLGGQTFAISILGIDNGISEVLATNGNPNLGGENIDAALVEFLIGKIESTQGVDLSTLDIRSRLTALQRIRLEAENAKKALSGSLLYEITLPYLAMRRDGTPVNFVYILNGSKLEELAQGFMDKTIELCQKTMAEAKVTASDIDEVLLVGGMAHMPLVVETVKRIFGKTTYISVKPDEAVALGAAIQAGILEGNVIE